MDFEEFQDMAMNLRCLFRHKPILVIDNIKLVDTVMFGDCFSFGGSIEESHHECARCGKELP